MKQLLFWATTFILGLTSCKSNQKVVYAPDQIVPTERALLWKVSGNGLKKPSFVYGTIHMIPKSDFELSDATRHAFDRSKRVVFEIDMKQMTNFKAQLSLITKSMMGGGKTLKDLISAEDYAFVKEAASKKGLPMGMIDRVKPMFLSMMLGEEEGGPDAESMGATTSVEMELYRMARRRKIQTGGLETAEYQMAVFDSIPYAVQAKMLVDGLRSTATLEAGEENQMEKMIRLYKSEDISTMQAQISAEEGMGNYEELLLNRRNRNWIAEMDYQMRRQSTFFAVGAGHLGGKSGVVALLRQAGFRVEAVINNAQP
ncbi:MAG: TraB/GumN family protein [Saprospiraceae bacterium]|nr:TraB/GumN family protein [Saprospiraceae bacterium]